MRVESDKNSHTYIQAKKEKKNNTVSSACDGEELDTNIRLKPHDKFSDGCEPTCPRVQ